MIISELQSFLHTPHNSPKKYFLHRQIASSQYIREKISGDFGGELLSGDSS